MAEEAQAAPVEQTGEEEVANAPAESTEQQGENVAKEEPSTGEQEAAEPMEVTEETKQVRMRGGFCWENCRSNANSRKAKLRQKTTRASKRRQKVLLRSLFRNLAPTRYLFELT